MLTKRINNSQEYFLGKKKSINKKNGDMRFMKLIRHRFLTKPAYILFPYVWNVVKIGGKRRTERNRKRDAMPVARPETSDSRVIAHVDMDCFYVQGILFLLLSPKQAQFVFLWVSVYFFRALVVQG